MLLPSKNVKAILIDLLPAGDVEAHFDGMESLSSGRLTIQQWNTLFAKHLEHHLGQFGFKRYSQKFI
jgi:hypothetical protein